MEHCNLNDPCTKVNRSNWYLSLFSDSLFHLANLDHVPYKTCSLAGCKQTWIDSDFCSSLYDTLNNLNKYVQ